MSRLDELIKELCPDGVEYKELGEYLDYIQPTKYIVESTDYKNEYSIPVLTAGQTFILGYTDEKKGIYEASMENPVIIFDDFTGSMHWIDFKFKIKSSAMKIIIPKANKTLNFKYFYYLLKNIKYFSETHTRLWISVFSKFLVPVPPLEVQDEIVRILDDYTKSVEELKEKLNKELIARKKQYSWYRDYLLKFKNKVEIVKLGSISELKSGGTPKTENLEYWENGNIPWMSSGEVNKGNIYETEKKITKEGYNNSSAKMLPKDTVVIALAGQGKTRGTVAITRIELCTNQSICGIIPNEKLNSDFLYHYLKTQYENLRQLSSGDGTRGGLNLKMLNNYLVPLPPLEVQKRIVEVLDNFEKTCKELNIELSSEIEVKQKEYEFVRNYLLTFEEKSRQAILACVASSKPKI